MSSQGFQSILMPKKRWEKVVQEARGLGIVAHTYESSIQEAGLALGYIVSSG